MVTGEVSDAPLGRKHDSKEENGRSKVQKKQRQ